MKLIEEQIKKATDICQEIEMLIASTKEDVKDSKSMTEVWNKMDDLHRDIEQLKLKQTATKRTKQEDTNLTPEQIAEMANLIERMAEEIENLYGRETELTEKARGYIDNHGLTERNESE